MPDKQNFNCVIDEPTYMSDRKGHNGITQDGTATTLTAEEKDRPLMATSVVRRLTPMECERLQGLPDGYTDIPDKTCSDSARYKALGNGMAQNVANWIIQRIVEEVENEPTISSES